LAWFGLPQHAAATATAPVWTEIAWPFPTDPWGKDVVGAWLVKIGADGTVSKVSFSTLVSNAPAATDLCKVQFLNNQLPWPPSPDAVPTTIPCGSQRPGVNVAPAVAADGTIYTISRTHFATRYGFLVAVNPNLTPKWAASLRDRLASPLS
jgi:hypothetical protein